MGELDFRRLEGHLERMASSGNVGSMREWCDFTFLVHSAIEEIECSRSAKAEPAAYVFSDALQFSGEVERVNLFSPEAPIGTQIPLYTAPPPPSVDAGELSNFIRKIDGDHTMGAGQLAERICEWLALNQ